MYEEDIDLLECYDEETCEICGRNLKIGYEEYETWGYVSRDRVLYCPNCD